VKESIFSHLTVVYSRVSQTVGCDPKVGREALSSGSPKFFMEIIIFCHLFVNWIKILFSSYHSSQSSPLSCKRAKLMKILTSHG